MPGYEKDYDHMDDKSVPRRAPEAPVKKEPAKAKDDAPKEQTPEEKLEFGTRGPKQEREPVDEAHKSGSTVP